MTRPREEGLDLPAHADERILALYGYWDSKRGTRPFPSRADLDPVEIPRLLPFLTLVDVRADQPRFLYRLVGTGAAQLLQRELTGKPVGTGVKAGELREVIGRYDRVADEGCCLYHRATLQEDRNDFTCVDRIMLPLGPTPPRVTMILGLVVGLRPLDVI